MALEANQVEVSGFRRAFATMDEVTIHYWIGGPPEGQPVLLWHGFLGTSYSWHKIMPLLAQAGYQVLVPDMRGYGDSDKPSGDAGYDGTSLGEEFRALVRQIAFGAGKPLLLVAHDMGAPPALLWAAQHPDEIAGLIYMECPVMLDDVLSEIIVYRAKQMEKGSMWWWVLPLAPGVPERLIVGHERGFLTWFYEGATYDPASINENAIEETLRTFAGVSGVLGALGVYRAAFVTIAQTSKLISDRVQVPVLALGGEKSLGSNVEQMLRRVAVDVVGSVIPSCGHFIPEEKPQALLSVVQDFVSKFARR